MYICKHNKSLHAKHAAKPEDPRAGTLRANQLEKNVLEKSCVNGTIWGCLQKKVVSVC